MLKPAPVFVGDVGLCVDDRRVGSEDGTGIGIGMGIVIWMDLRLGSLELFRDCGDEGRSARPRGVSDPGRASPALIVLVLVRLGVEVEDDRSMGGARLEASAAAASSALDVVLQNDARFAGGRSEDRRSG